MKTSIPGHVSEQRKEIAVLFLIELDHVKSSPLSTPEAGRAFIEQIILPTLVRAQQLTTEKKIVAGGLAAGRISPRFIVEAESATDVDRMLFSIPLWPVAETRVTPLVSFQERQSRVEEALNDLSFTPSRLERFESSSGIPDCDRR